MNIPTHPFVVCNIEGVRVQALVDTGSMKSFIKKDIQDVIDFDCRRVNKSTERCNSITGDSLKIVGKINVNVNFSGSRHSYCNDFLISSNIEFDCVLGWDFLVNNHVDLRRGMLGGLSSYVLEGPHEKTPVCARVVPNETHLSGVVESSDTVDKPPDCGSEHGGDSYLLFQSRYKAATEICLTENVVIPARTELVLEGKLVKTTSADVGMITANRARAYEPGIHISHIVAHPCGKIVPVRVLNSSHESVELTAGRKIAEFHQLVKSKPQSEQYTKTTNATCAATCSETADFQSQVHEAISPHLNEKDRIKLAQLLSEFSDVFDDKLDTCNVTFHKINTGRSTPIKQRPRRLPYAYRDEADQQIQEMLANGIITPSVSPWSSPIVLVRKKNGDLRFCVDYRKLNQITDNDSHPLPLISDLLDSVKDAKYFSLLDLRSGYWQIPVAQEDRAKTAFVTQNGLYEFTRMPFGLKTAPATFQRAMEVILAGLTFEICLCYLDDVIVFGKTLTEHNDRLKTVLTRFRDNNLRVKLAKCVFASPQVTYLGHCISRQGVSPDPTKLRNQPKPSVSKSQDVYFRKMLRHYDKLFIREGILVRAIGQRKSYPNYVIVLPQSLITTCVKAMHDSPFAGHMGVARTEERIRQRFYWPGIHTSVQTFIHNCHACAQRKIATHNNKAPTQHIEVGEPFTFWAMDYMGPLPETARGNRHILVMMDHFSKWCEAFPTKDQKASTVANILLHKVFSRFGPPTVLHSDQGANFESNLMHELCDLMGIAKTRTSAYHPQCDGQVERQNRTLQDMLSKFVSNHADDWDQWLDPVVFAYNTSRHDSTGYSPYEMIFGRTPRMPFELEIGMPLSNPAQNTEYIHSTRRMLQDIHNIARSNLADNRARQDKRNAKSTSWKPYLAGQAVWLKRPKQWKFGPTWVGPYKVLERLGVNYRIKRQDGKVSIVHHDNLKLSRIPSGNGQIVPPTPESGDLEVVEPLFEAQNVGCEGTRGTNGVPRVRPARLRQNVQPPKRYGVD